MHGVYDFVPDSGDITSLNKNVLRARMQGEFNHKMWGIRNQIVMVEELNDKELKDFLVQGLYLGYYAKTAYGKERVEEYMKVAKIILEKAEASRPSLAGVVHPWGWWMDSQLVIAFWRKASDLLAEMGDELEEGGERYVLVEPTGLMPTLERTNKAPLAIGKEQGGYMVEGMEGIKPYKAYVSDFYLEVVGIAANQHNKLVRECSKNA